MARITIEDCLEKIDNHFKLVLVASHRAQQLQAGVAPKIEVTNEKPAIIALREIAEGLVGEDILDEPLLVQDATAEDELAALLTHGLMDQEVSSDLNDITEEEDDDDSMKKDTLKTETETIEQMEEITDLNLDHLKAGDNTDEEVDSALTDKLSESEIAMGEKLLSQADETVAAAAGKTVENAPASSAETPEKGESAEKEPA